MTYPLYGLAGSVPYVIGVNVAIALAGENGIWGPLILGVTLLVSVAYVIGLPILGALILPRVGVDWDPNGYGLATWALLAIGGFWYALIFAIPLALLGIVLSLPSGW
ncbi:hypothetical protein [Natronosalvus rutilus]|uniref:DUF8162 domain-containing protein n=1 Tax=Natronosalvus rutilus TaxID=2953753 RepID=A0A9E7NAM9_9EURY|nr:hypothetical protein [Natronosalvus rutilus]UTF54869.1 hypothetical protein NGM29_06320 [Natronosalvus rutilus]